MLTLCPKGRWFVLFHFFFVLKFYTTKIIYIFELCKFFVVFFTLKLNQSPYIDTILYMPMETVSCNKEFQKSKLKYG